MKKPLFEAALLLFYPVDFCFLFCAFAVVLFALVVALLAVLLSLDFAEAANRSLSAAYRCPICGYSVIR